MEKGKALTPRRNPNTRIGLWFFRGTAAVASFALAASGCGNSSNDGHPAPLTFDYLGGGSKVIEVFPGVSNSLEDRRYDGTYYDGDQVTADCKTTGRKVSSNPSVGELPRQSDEWFSIEGPSPDGSYYVPAVYTEHPGQLWDELPNCSD